MQILWVSFLASVGVFCALTFLVEGQVITPAAYPLIHAYMGIAFTIAVFAVAIPPIILRISLRRDKSETERTLDHEQNRNRALQRYYTSFIVGLALSEAVGVFGFLTHLEGVKRRYSIPFFVVSAVLMIVNRPTLKRLDASVSKVFGAGLV